MDMDQVPLDKLNAGQKLLTAAAAAVGRGDLEDALHAVDQAELTAASARESVVWMMRRRGYTWQQIGNVLGITRQSAHERFG